MRTILAASLLLSGCVLYVGNDDSVMAEIERPQHVEPFQCPVNVPELSEDEEPWIAPVISAWPKNVIPVVSIPTDRAYCKIETIQPAIDFWCKNLGVCMQAEYIDTLPPESEYAHGRVYVIVATPPDPTKGGQAFWWADDVCHENSRAIVYVTSCSGQLWAHELGHTLGFGHSSDVNDIMFSSSAGLRISSYAVAAYKLAQLPKDKNQLNP